MNTLWCSFDAAQQCRAGKLVLGQCDESGPNQENGQKIKNFSIKKVSIIM